MQNMFNLHYDKVSNEKNVVLPDIVSVNASVKSLKGATASQYSSFSQVGSNKVDKRPVAKLFS
jgi:hypothetical protein